MSDTKPLGGIKDGNFIGMPQNDVDFIVACLRCAVGGSVIINTPRAAEILEYKNHRSITNRLKHMKDRYGLNMSGTTKPINDNTPEDEEETESATFEEPAVDKAPRIPVKKASAVKKAPISKKEKPATKAKASKKTPATKKRKASAISEEAEIKFPGLDSAGDADVSDEGTNEKVNTADEESEEECA